VSTPPSQFERGPEYDLEERLLKYAAAVIRIVEKTPESRSANHVVGQLLRSGTSPLPNHGEAQAAESADDFVHTMRVCLKELRETRRWLRLLNEVPLTPDTAEVDRLIKETVELVKIFAASIRTCLQNARGNIRRPNSTRDATRNVSPPSSFER
jgi:four helix bundle protein